MLKHYLYKITNTLSGKCYLGITCDPKRRKYEHLRKKSGSFSLVRLAVDRHGIENFTFEVLVAGRREYISDLEDKAIILFDSIANGYNIKPGGDNRSSGYSIDFRKDDKPVCVLGFWFPNRRTALKALKINSKTFHKRQKDGTLHLEAKPLKAIQRPERGSEADTRKRSASMQGKNIGSSNGMSGKRNTSRSSPITIFGIEYPSITEATRQTDYTKSMIEKRLKKGDPNFSYLR
jgi:group I intron endonuclease